MYHTYSADKRLKDLHKNYAVFRLTGPKGAIYSDDLTTAISIQGPNTWYPDHVHRQREVYGVIGGEADWIRGAEPTMRRKSGEVIYHPSGLRHGLWTREEPLLSFASWIDHVHLPPAFVWE
jgi:mannose-6-phosphate isomerase-like protein (cupin superfamily)